MSPPDDYHCFRTDPQVRWQGIADVLETDPAAWDWDLANIGRWLTQGRLHPAPLLEWRQWLLDARKAARPRSDLLEALFSLCRRPFPHAHTCRTRFMNLAPSSPWSIPPAR